MTDIVEPVTGEDMDVFAHRYVQKKFIQFERMLAHSKWFDYRFLHPVEATRLYVEAYEGEYRAAYASTFSTLRSQYVKFTGWSEMVSLLEDPDKGRKHREMLAGFWRGRQVADAIGMPYDLYIRLALKERLRFWKQRYLPNPSMLYSELIVERVAELWKERQTARLYVGNHRNYYLHRYIGSQAQNDHHEWLFNQAQIRSNPSYQLARFIQDELLPEEKVRSRVGDERFGEIQTYY